MELARQVREFMTWKQVECPFEEDRTILHYLQTAPIFSEDGQNLLIHLTDTFHQNIGDRFLLSLPRLPQLFSTICYLILVQDSTLRPMRVRVQRTRWRKTDGKLSGRNDQRGTRLWANTLTYYDSSYVLFPQVQCSGQDMRPLPPATAHAFPLH